MDLDAVAAELYGLPPGEFTSVRNARAVEARRGGDRDLAVAITRLRRPTVGAWLVNLLARERRDEISGLLGLGAAMREAQQTLAASDLRQLSQQRQHVINVLSEVARQLAAGRGHRPSDASVQEVAATLQAALADPAAAGALAGGRLTTALHYSGFGPSAGVAAFPVPAPTRPQSPAGDSPQAPAARPAPSARLDEYRRRRVRRELAQQALTEAEAAAASAEAEASDLGRRVSELQAEQEQQQRDVQRLQQQLRELRAAEQQSAHALLSAERALQAAAKTVRTAHDKAARARLAVDRLAPLRDRRTPRDHGRSAPNNNP